VVASASPQRWPNQPWGEKSVSDLFSAAADEENKSDTGSPKPRSNIRKRATKWPDFQDFFADSPSVHMMTKNRITRSLNEFCGLSQVDLA
jgi:hypothetical protein